MSSMSKPYYPLLITLSILVLFLLYWIRPQPATSVSQPISAGYLAQAVEHRVAIYKIGTPAPLITTQIDTRTLPPADQARLQQGIPLGDQTEIDGFLQDFDS